MSAQRLCAGAFVSVLIGLTHGAAIAAVLCVSTAAELASALLAAATNGETDVIQMIQGTFESTNSTILANNTITGNIGTGMRVELYDNSDTAKISNNIIWNNSGPSGGDLFLENDGNGDGQPSGVDLLPNDFDPSQIVIPLPFPIDPSNPNHIDPAVVSANLDDYHLQVGSPVIDQGDNSAPGPPLTDQEGRPRILQGTVDLGVFEFGVADIVNIIRAAFINRHASSSCYPPAHRLLRRLSSS